MLTKLYPAVAVALIVSAASAQTITYSGPSPDQGTGFGTVLPVLVLGANGSESGSVQFVGGVDSLSGDATNQSQTQTVSAMQAAGINVGNLALVFNIAEPGSETDLTLQGFTVRFYDAAGNTLFDAVYGASQTLEQIGGGVGGAGHIYSIALTPAQATQFFSDPNNRIGMLIGANTPILNSGGAPDGFYVIPTPGAATLMALGAVSLRRGRR